MYGKLFESMYDGTLVEDWRALVTFQQMIVLCDADGMLDMTAGAISNRTGIPLEHIVAGIEILEQVDLNSRTPDSEGRRIVRLDEHRAWGWYIVNHNKYKQLVDADVVRKQNRIRKQRQRDNMSHDVTPCHALSRNVTGENAMSRDVTRCHALSRHTDTDINIDIDLKDQDLKSIVRQKPPDPPPIDKKIKKPKNTVKIQAQLILVFFNDVTGKNFDPVDANLSIIGSRLTEAEKMYKSKHDAALLCRRIIMDRKRTWEDDDSMRDYLRPKTIFAKSNFWNYAGGLPTDLQIHKSTESDTDA
jgi:uncharacterized phage protein (TIGR02220 family)